MPISSIWTIATGPQTGTLDGLGIVGATLSERAQGDGTLTLRWADPLANRADWSHGAVVTLARSGTIVFYGKVNTRGRTLSVAEASRTVVVSGCWESLDRTPYGEEWQSWNGSAVATVKHARFSVGAASSGGKTTDTVAALGEVVTWAAARGLPITLGTTPTTKTVPRIDGHSASCGDVLRRILRWHPECAVYVAHAGTGWTLNVVPVASLSAVTLDASHVSPADIEIAYDESACPENVVVSWEATVVSGSAEAGTEEDRLQVYQETAGGTSIGEGTVFFTLPVTLPSDNATTQEMEIVTRTIPANGATNEAAEKWWLKHSPELRRWGITAADIILPSTTSGTIKAHTKTAVTDELDDIEDSESDFSPPSYWTDDLTKLPRELIVGEIQEWMRRSVGRVRCEVTVGVKKSVVDALSAEARAEVLAYGSEVTEIGGQDAYLLQLVTEVRATNALSRVYQRTVPGTGNTVPAVSEQIITGLATAYYNATKDGFWTGQITLTEAEVGLVNPLSRKLNLSHPLRTEWATMGAQVSGYTANLATGQTTRTLGRPPHLALQDFAELIRIGRQQETGQILLGGGPQKDSDAKRKNKRGGKVRQGGFGPIQTDTAIPLGNPPEPRRWELVAVPDSDPTTYTLRLGKIWDGEEEVDVTVDTSATAYEPVDGGAFWLEQEGYPDVAEDWDLRLKAGEKPTDQWTYDGDLEAMEFVKKTLVTFHATDPGGVSLPVGALWARLRVADTDLLAIDVAAWDEDESRLFPAIEFAPA